MHGEPETLRRIVEGGGDYRIQLQANQPTARARAKTVATAGFPLLPPKP